MNNGFKPDEKYLRRQRHRNIALGVILIGFAVLFYAITIVRIQDAG